MSLTRNFLKGMGLNEEQIGAIIDEHVDTVNSLKADRDKYKTEAEKLPGVQKELNDLKEKGDGGWQKKYEDEHSAFEAYKTAEAAKQTKSNKIEAYKALLNEAKVSEKAINVILKGTDLESFELDENGKVKDAAKILETIKTEYADFITTEGTSGAGTKTPPGGAGASTFEAMSIDEKMAYANKNPNAPEVTEWLKKE